MNIFGGLDDCAKSVLKMIAEGAAARYPYYLPKDIMIWFEEHMAHAKQRLAAAMAYAVHQSVEEAHIRGAGGDTLDNHYEGAQRVSRVPTTCNS